MWYDKISWAKYTMIILIFLVFMGTSKDYPYINTAPSRANTMSTRTIVLLLLLSCTPCPLTRWAISQ